MKTRKRKKNCNELLVDIPKVSRLLMYNSIIVTSIRKNNLTYAIIVLSIWLYFISFFFLFLLNDNCGGDIGVEKSTKKKFVGRSQISRCFNE